MVILFDLYLILPAESGSKLPHLQIFVSIYQQAWAFGTGTVKDRVLFSPKMKK
jgi:hypothetical protein